MATRRPARPIMEEGRPSQHRNGSWCDKLDSTGDITLAIVCIVFFPVLYPLSIIERWLDKRK